MARIRPDATTLSCQTRRILRTLPPAVRPRRTVLVRHRSPVRIIEEDPAIPDKPCPVPTVKLVGMNNAIEAEGLARSFGDNDAVRGIDLAIPDGQIYGFLGPNGAGKSTTVRILCTLLAPTGGHARVAGFDVVGKAGDVRLRIGVALQDTSIDEKQTGRELLTLQGRLYGLRSAEISRRLDDVIGLVDIGEAIDRRVGTYSGGMKRRLDLAMALVHEPEVLFLDEPTTGLDPVSRARVWDEIRRLNTDLGMTIFLTTQYLEEADALADRVGIITEGTLAVQGSPDELKRSIGTDVIVATVDGDAALAVAAAKTVSGLSNIDERDGELSMTAADGSALIADVAVALKGSGVDLRSLTLRTPTLDDVFLHVTGSHFSSNGSTR
jgi:ABC-2 type transport system ATP-binding protein